MGSRRGGGGGGWAARRAVAWAEQRSVRLHAQWFAAYSSHGLGVQRNADVEFAGEYTGRNLGAEEFAGDDGDVGDVLFDGRQNRAERLVAGGRGVAQSHCSGDPFAGEAGALGGSLERGKRQR